MPNPPLLTGTVVKVTPLLSARQYTAYTFPFRGSVYDELQAGVGTELYEVAVMNIEELIDELMSELVVTAEVVGGAV